MLLENLLQILVPVRLKRVDQLLYRHELNGHDGRDVRAVSELAHLALRAACVEEAVEGERLGVRSDQAHRPLSLDRLFTFVPPVSILGSTRARARLLLMNRKRCLGLGPSVIACDGDVVDCRRVELLLRIVVLLVSEIVVAAP